VKLQKYTGALHVKENKFEISFMNQCTENYASDYHKEIDY
jgi:hypothetical protein